MMDRTIAVHSDNFHKDKEDSLQSQEYTIKGKYQEGWLVVRERQSMNQRDTHTREDGRETFQRGMVRKS